MCQKHEVSKVHCGLKVRETVILKPQCLDEYQPKCIIAPNINKAMKYLIAIKYLGQANYIHKKSTLTCG